MKIKVDNYTFNKTNKTITLNDYASLPLENLLLITNVTSGTILFMFNDPSLLATIENNIITLSIDTSSMLDSDKLQIFIDDGKHQLTNDELRATPLIISDPNLLAELQNKVNADESQLVEAVAVLRNILQVLANPAYVDKTANQLRAQITGAISTITTLTTVTTVSTVSNITNIGSYQATQLLFNQNNMAWASLVRNRIS